MSTYTKTSVLTRDGRTINIDGEPALYLDPNRNPNGPRAVAPWQADSVARQLYAAIKAGVIVIPLELHEVPELDARTYEAHANIMRYNDALNELELAPNGDDYNALLDFISGAEYRKPHIKGR